MGSNNRGRKEGGQREKMGGNEGWKIEDKREEKTKST